MRIVISDEWSGIKEVGIKHTGDGIFIDVPPNVEISDIVKILKLVLTIIIGCKKHA